MPTVRYSFSCHTKEDRELIEWLDGFATPRKRNEEIKKKLLGKSEAISINDEQLERIEKTMQKVYKKLLDIRYVEPKEEQQESQGELTEDQRQEALENLLGGIK